MAGDNDKSIIIADQLFELAGDLKVITFKDVGGYSFPAKRAKAMAEHGSSLFADRRIPKKGTLKTYDDLVGNVKQIILHTDLTRDSKKCFDVLVGRGLSTHFMIDWDGTIYQGCDPLYAAFHAGEHNNDSIGIDLNNKMVNLTREPGAPAYDPKHERIAEMSKKEYRRPKSGRMRINQGRVQAYGYTDAQYQSLIELLKVLCDQLEIPRECPFDPKGEIVPDVLEDTGFSGFIAHWHVAADRWDPGPGFDWQRVFYGLKGEFNSFPVELTADKNIKTLLEPAKVKAYAEDYYANNELSPSGGWYPIGLNQTWHGGVHLHGNKGDNVLAMFDGVLVAARFGKEAAKLGHNNFMILKHTVPIPPKTKGAEPKKFEFYSLYMHLAPVDFSALTADSPKWVKEMMRVDEGKTSADEEDFVDAKGGEGDEERGDEPRGEFGDEMEEDIVEGAIDKRKWLDVGLGLAALKSGRVAKIEYRDKPVRIRAGDPIGKIGKFGPSQDEWLDVVHVEVFADPAKDWKEAVNLGIHGRYLVELDDDVGADLFIENADILSLFSTRRRASSSLVPQRVLASADIAELFTAGADEFVEEKRYLRKLVTRHISEWSDAVDWVSVLSKGETWDDKISDFRKILKKSALGVDAIATVLPWIWLSKDVAEHIGLDTADWRGILDHFHPIQFLIWLTFHSTQRIQSISRGVSKKRLEALREKEKKKAEQQRFQAREGFGASFFIEEPEAGDAGEVLQRWMQQWDMGEWERAFEDEEGP